VLSLPSETVMLSQRSPGGSRNGPARPVPAVR
jgi:hypothetical protein